MLRVKPEVALGTCLIHADANMAAPLPLYPVDFSSHLKCLTKLPCTVSASFCSWGEEIASSFVDPVPEVREKSHQVLDPHVWAAQC